MLSLYLAAMALCMLWARGIVYRATVKLNKPMRGRSAGSCETVTPKVPNPIG